MLATWWMSKCPNTRFFRFFKMAAYMEPKKREQHTPEITNNANQKQTRSMTLANARHSFLTSSSSSSSFRLKIYHQNISFGSDQWRQFLWGCPPPPLFGKVNKISDIFISVYYTIAVDRAENSRICPTFFFF